MPTDVFWDGIGKSIERASGDIVVAAVFVIGVIFLLIKYYLPERRSQKKFDAEMQQRRLELEIKQQQDTADIQRESIEQKAREMEILSGVQTTQETLVTVVRDVAMNQKVLIERIDDSKSHSQSLVSTQNDIKDEVMAIRDKVDDIHRVIYKPAVTD